MDVSIFVFTCPQEQLLSDNRNIVEPLRNKVRRQREMRADRTFRRQNIFIQNSHCKKCLDKVSGLFGEQFGTSSYLFFNDACVSRMVNSKACTLYIPHPFYRLNRVMLFQKQTHPHSPFIIPMKATERSIEILANH